MTNLLTKLIKLFKSKQFLKFFVSGALAFVVDFSILTVLYYIAGMQGFFTVEILGIDLILKHANLISVFVAMIFGYYLQARITFKSSASKSTSEKSKYFMVNVFNYIVQNILFGYATELLFIPAAIAKVFLVLLQMVWTFGLYKFVVFRKK